MEYKNYELVLPFASDGSKGLNIDLLGGGDLHRGSQAQPNCFHKNHPDIWTMGADYTFHVQKKFRDYFPGT